MLLDIQEWVLSHRWRVASRPIWEPPPRHRLRRPRYSSPDQSRACAYSLISFCCPRSGLRTPDNSSSFWICEDSLPVVLHWTQPLRSGGQQTATTGTKKPRDHTETTYMDGSHDRRAEVGNLESGLTERKSQFNIRGIRSELRVCFLM